MTNIDHLLDRNRAFAGTDARQNVPALPFLPRQALYIVICIDCRVDPAQTLGIELGDALVQRNIGGRVTPAVIRDIAYAELPGRDQGPAGPVVRGRGHSPHRLRLGPCWPTTNSATATRSGSASTSGPSPTRRSWTRRAPSAPTCSASCGPWRSRRTSRSQVTSTTSRPAWSPPSLTRKPPEAPSKRSSHDHSHPGLLVSRGDDPSGSRAVLQRGRVDPHGLHAAAQAAAALRERVHAEHALVHVGRWQGRRARYRGRRKNLFDLRRVAVVHNLHVIARQPATDSYQVTA